MNETIRVDVEIPQNIIGAYLEPNIALTWAFRILVALVFVAITVLILHKKRRKHDL